MHDEPVMTAPDVAGKPRSEGPKKPVSTVMALYLLTLYVGQIQPSSTTILELDEGSTCEPLQGGPGTCTLLSKCRYPGDFKKEHPPICTFRGMEPIICCPKMEEKLLEDKFDARQYCRSLLDTCEKDFSALLSSTGSDDLSTLPPLIVYGGEPSRPKTHTHMALIGYGSSDEKQWGCGGSLVNSRFVLSAAHCANPQLLGDARWARLGDLDISTSADDAGIQEREIIQRIVHPGYKEPQVYNDIALFKLDQDVLFTSWVRPVCLYTENVIPILKATVTGWGRVEFAGATSSQLLEADLEIFSEYRCRNLLPDKDNKTPRGIDSRIMFCAGKTDGSKDACSGDSGGPLVISKPDQCLKTQIGITSYGNHCGLPDSPGVYTRVSNYISWIEEVSSLK